jgi:hypothetical protein
VAFRQRLRCALLSLVVIDVVSAQFRAGPAPQAEQLSAGWRLTLRIYLNRGRPGVVGKVTASWRKVLLDIEAGLR